MNSPIRTITTTSVLALAVLTGCSTSTEPPGVASLSDNDAANAAASSTPAQDPEAALLSFVECLRSKGLDVPDPTVDADGNLSFRPRSVMSQGTVDREKLRAGMEACGGPPEGLGGGFSREDRTRFQDTALKFAECMRGQGLDVPDPDFSAGAPRAGGGGPFGRQLDRDDPKVAAALEVCQQIFADSGLGQPGGGS
jgi:hypothetical protein